MRASLRRDQVARAAEKSCRVAVAGFGRETHLAGAHQPSSASLQVLQVGGALFSLMMTKSAGKLLHAPIFVGAQQLADDVDVIGLVNEGQDDGTDRRKFPATRALDDRSGVALKMSGDGPQGGIGIDHAVGELLEQMRLVGADAQMVELHLRLRPGKGECALEGLMSRCLSANSSTCSRVEATMVEKTDARSGAGGNANGAAQADDGIEHRADRAARAGVPSITEDGIVSFAAAADELARDWFRIQIDRMASPSTALT